MAQTLLLAGRPGVGKTTVIKAVALALGERAGGFYTEEERESGRRQGFRLVGLDGEKATLAHVRLKGQSHPRVGRYGVDVDALDRVGVAALERAITQRQIIIIDEIGKMELFSTRFKTAVSAAMDGAVPVIGTVLDRPHPWVDTLKARSDVTRWQVTMENRDQMASLVLAWVDSVH